MKKIALIGTAPHRVEAPYNDPSWTIWVTSPGNIGQVPRWDAWFELHDLEMVKIVDGIDLGQQEFFRTDHGKPIFMCHRRADFPSAVDFDWRRLEAKYPPTIFTSSLAWMFAKALEEGAKVIGLWGVDCAAVGEWADQRPALQRFFEIASSRGVKVVLPKASLLRLRPKHYAAEPLTVMEVAMWEKRYLLARKLDEAKAQHAAVVADINQITGAIAVLDDILISRGGVPLPGDFGDVP